MVGFDGPIVMTHPTKAIIPLMLEDYMKVWNKNQRDRDQKFAKKQEGLSTGDDICYTQDQIQKCLKKIQVIKLHETMEFKGIKVKAYYAGHVLGAVMFHIEY